MAVKFCEYNHMTIYNGDSRNMTELADETAQCVTTSPPYWGLRKYEGDQDLIWGGDKDCVHEWGNFQPIADGVKTRWTHNPTSKRDTRIIGVGPATCRKCGAWKGAFGLEPTPELYVQHTVEILREIRRVLRKDGVVFWNIGDSYASGKGTCFNPGGGKGSFSGHGDRKDAGAYPLDRGNISMLKASGLKPKDLCLIPFRIAIALQEDGWWVRSVIIWNKPNPMPESVGDRPTNTYEFILMVTKSGTTQYWTHRDHEGTRKQPKPDYRWIKQVTNIRGLKTKGVQEVSNQEQHHGQDIAPQITVEEVAIKPDGWTPKNKMGWDRINLWQGHDYYWDADAVREEYSPTVRWGGDKYNGAVKQYPNNEDAGLARERSCYPNSGRNLRDVWTFPTAPYPEAHFAVFPEKLPELCIKAATSEKGCCPKCGAPWVRALINTGKVKQGWGIQTKIPPESGGHTGLKTKMINQFETVGWRPSCSCGLEPVRCVVLDPFAGTGTTGVVARHLGRTVVLYELSTKYCKFSLERNRQMVM